MKTYPSLYHKSKTGKTVQWDIKVEGSKIITEWFQLPIGKVQRSEVIATPKNVGRSNETTSEQQAIIEGDAMWKFQIDRKYSDTIEEAQETIFLPMLARSKNFSKDEKIEYPVHVQPKLDGVRCLTYWNDEGTEVLLQSRNGKFYNVPQVAKALSKFLPKDSMLDGELYCHGVGFQTVTSWCKKLQEETKNITYNIYDCPKHYGDYSKPWSERCKDLYEIAEEAETLKLDCIVLVGAYECNSSDEVYKWQKSFVSEGYEGAIIRKLDGKYLFGQRSRTELLKVKSFMEDDFEVINYTTGLPGTKEANAVIWCCKTIEGKFFNVRPKGTIKARIEALKDAKSFISKMYSVKFFEYTDDLIPRFPTGEGFKCDR